MCFFATQLSCVFLRHNSHVFFCDYRSKKKRDVIVQGILSINFRYLNRRATKFKVGGGGEKIGEI